VSPILAPLAGSFLIEWSGWRAVFWTVTVAAVLAVLLMATSLPETRPPEQRVGSTAKSALAAYWLLLRDAHFMGLVLIGGFGISAFFAYLANSSFVLIDHYGLTTRQYSYAFAANAISFIGMSQFTGQMIKRFGMVPLVRAAAMGFSTLMLLALLLNLLGQDGMWPMLALLFAGYGCLGLVLPASSVLALDAHGEIAGTASALMGTLQFMTGAAVMAIVGTFVDGTARPMLVGIAGSAVVTLLITLGTLRGDAAAKAASASPGV
jgi:DHA1 family bicyclomycin/chloramphenicol resistance-like MFS transporter